MPDTRIQSLADEVDRLRRSRHSSDSHLQSLILKVTEIQLNLATQDRTLAKLEAAINGNGKPGLITRMDRVERIAGGLVKAVWLLTTAIATTLVKVMIDRLK